MESVANETLKCMRRLPEFRIVLSLCNKHSCQTMSKHFGMFRKLHLGSSDGLQNQYTYYNQLIECYFHKNHLDKNKTDSE